MSIQSDSDIIPEDMNMTVPIGVPLPYFGASAPTDHLFCNGDTIGDGSSGSTGRANADTETLFNLLWASFADAQLPIYTSAGGASTRGASAAADWAAHKRMSLPNLKGRVIVGLDSGQTEFDVNGETGGEKTHQLTVAELAAHTHNVSANPGASSPEGLGNEGGSPVTYSAKALSTGGDTPHNNLQPYIALRYIVRYKYYATT